MQIKSVEVVRFGPLPAGFSRSFPATGLIPIYGPNEAGKSSLLDLIRGVLYGWPQGQVTRYAADGLGGRVVVVGTAGEQISVERVGRQFKAIGENATLWNEAAWFDWLGTSASVFKNIYGFGLGELERLDSLSPAELGTQLISAGLGLRVNLDQVLKGLDDQCANLFKPKGVKLPLNEMQRHLQALDKEIRSAESQEAGYVQVVRQLEQAGEAVTQAEALVRARQAAKDRLETLAKRLPRWREFQQQRHALEELSGIEALPEGASERLADVVQALGRIDERQTVRMQQWDDLQQKMPSRSRRQAAQDARWRALLEEVPAVAEHLGQATELESRADALSLQLKEKASSLGVDADRLTSESLPVAPLEARCGQFEQELARLKDAWTQAYVRRQGLETQRNDLREQWEAVSGVPARAEYDQRKRLLEGLVVEAPAAPKADAGWWIGVVILGLAAALVPAPLVKSVLAVLVAVVGGVAIFMTRRLAGNGRRAELQAAGLSSEAQLMAQWEDWMSREPQVAARERLEQSLAGRQAALDEAVRDEESRRQEMETGAEHFQAWCREESLPEGLSPSDVGKWLLRAEGALADAVRLRELRLKATEAQETIAAWLDRAQQLVGELEVDVRGGREIASWVHLYEEWREAATLEDQERELQGHLEGLRAEKAHWESALDALLTDAGVPTIQAFREREEQNRMQKALREAIAGLERELSAGFDGADWAAVYATWAARDLDREMETAQEAGEEARARLRDAYARQADLHQTKRDLESKGMLPTLRQQRAELFREAERLAEIWAVHYVASKLLREAVERFQRERQPEVMRRASEWFRLVTEGAYDRVFATMGNRSQIVVETPGGRTFAPDALSRGTREQLYLSLRLAWIDERAAHGRILPLILDDILVNADPGRQRRLVELLRVFGERYQVLYLTCHPEMVRLFEEVGINARVDMVS